MIVLDTNVLSEMLRPQPDPSVMDWIDSITHSMIVLLRCLAHDVFEIDLRGRLLGFDRDAADACAVIGSIRPLDGTTRGTCGHDDRFHRAFARSSPGDEEYS